jgi:hypothetical protein
VLNDPVNYIDPLGLMMYRNGYDTKPIGQQFGELVNVFKPWAQNKAHSGAILGATITGLKAAAETKNPYAGAVIGAGTLGASCIGCHLGLPLVIGGQEGEYIDSWRPRRKNGPPCN